MRFMIESARVTLIGSLVIAGVACAVLADCTAGSSGGSSAESPESPGASVTRSGSPVAAGGCTPNATAVSAAVRTQVAGVSATRFQSPEVPVRCAFQTSSPPVLTVQISAFPFTAGRFKNLSLHSIKDGLAQTDDVLTSRITEHPEWGTDAFSALLYNSRHAVGVQIWTTRYSAAIDDVPGTVSDSAYLADATNLGNALVAAAK